MSNSNATLNVEITNDDDINSIGTCTPILDKNIKDHMHTDDCNSAGYILSYFEPIKLIFNLKDALNNFWFFSNRHAKRHKNNGEGFTLDVNYGS